MSESLYDILGVLSSSSTDEIRRAYLKLALLHHPDKTTTPNDSNRFTVINAAYDTLSNSLKRERYDFEQRLLSRTERKSLIVINVNVSLEEFYNGVTKNITTHLCAPCIGRGVVFSMRAIQPGLFQSIQTLCVSCSGSGRDIKTITLTIEKGMTDRFVINKNGFAFILIETGHDIFSRGENNSLNVDMEISIVDSLCGFSKTLITLDGRHITISKDTPTNSSCLIMCIEDEGMMCRGSNLYVSLKVVFPNRVENKEIMRELLDKCLFY